MRGLCTKVLRGKAKLNEVSVYCNSCVGLPAVNAGQEEAQGDFLASGVGWSSPAKALCRCCAVGGPWPAASPCAGKKLPHELPVPVS